MKHYLITSQLKTDSVGGVNTIAKLFLALFPKYTSKELTLTEAFVSIFNSRSFLIFGYADSAVYKVFILFLLRGCDITYCPCFHPWWTMRRKYLAFFYERSIFLVLLRSRNIICLSSFEEAYFKKLYKKANTILINHPVKMSSKLVYPNRTSIIFIGRDDTNKQINEFIQLKNLIDSWGEGYRFEVVSDTDRVFDGNIIHHRYLNEGELSSLYSRASAILITSKWESLSLVGVEAVFAGAKVVCRETVMLGERSKYFPSLILSSYRDINSLRAFLRAPIDKGEHERFIKSFSFENMKNTLLGVL
jgi:glycosyltransferase involved in cell wall biosynthesis